MVQTLQSFVSIQRIEKYLSSAQVAIADTLDGSHNPVAFQSATVAWPQDVSNQPTTDSAIGSAPRRSFLLLDLSLEFPTGELSLVCGKLGSGKTLLLLCEIGRAHV